MGNRLPTMGFFDGLSSGWRWSKGGDESDDQSEEEYQQQNFGHTYRPRPAEEEEEEPQSQYASELEGEMHGPYLKYQGMDLNRRIWKASVMIVVQRENSQPGLFLSYNGRTRNVRGFILESFKTWTFWRYDLKVPVQDDEQTIEYWFAHDEDRKYQVAIAGFEESWRQIFYSCNGFSSDVDEERQKLEEGIQPLWEDVFRYHRRAPYHVQIGGGDQIYMDLVRHDCELLKEWCDFTKEAKIESPYTEEMKEQAENYYFDSYIKHFGSERFRDALATIPFIFILDDHDIWDGYGSYPKELQTSPVFLGAGYTAFTYYLLFQQHTTRRRAAKDGYIGKDGYSFVRLLGPSAAVLCPDTRSERSLEQVLAPESWDEIRDDLSHMPSSVKHLVVVAAIPVAYPRLEAQDMLSISQVAVTNTLEFFDEVAKIFPWGHEDDDKRKEDSCALSDALRKTGAYKGLINNFGESELLDDLNDHWTAEVHVEERKQFIEFLQEFARNKNVRVTLVSGDVHCCGVGKFHSKGKEDDPESDVLTMYNIVSSAIGNIPPPGLVIKTLHFNSKVEELNDETEERMVETFHQDVNGEELCDKYLLNRRNWCDLLPNAYGGYECRLHVEKDDKWDRAEVYTTVVPPVLSE